MSPDQDAVAFARGLESAVKELGGHSAACLRLDNPRLRESVTESKERMQAWLSAGGHGDMDYLVRTFPARTNPWQTYAFAESVIVVAFTNHWGQPNLPTPFPKPAHADLVGYVSAYAAQTDYHHTGRQLLGSLAQRLPEGLRVEATVDTAPVDERLLAQLAGLGQWAGNNLIRIPGGVNTRVLLGCLFVGAKLPEVIGQPCFSFPCDACRACERNCPGGALRFGQPIQAERCISYLTMEKRGLLNREEGALLGRWIFGCDACTSSCPSENTNDLRVAVDLTWLLLAPAARIRPALKDNATAYAGITRLRRNAVVVLKNTATPAARALLDKVRAVTGSELIRQQIDLW